jgi:hypothetical protein
MKKFNLQSAKFNGSLRKGIRAFGRLSLNFAICTLLIGGAQGAKLCYKNLSVAGDSDAQKWAIGDGCNGDMWNAGSTDFKNVCSVVYFTGTAMMTTEACTPGQTATNPGTYVFNQGYGWCKLSGKTTWVCMGDARQYSGQNATSWCTQAARWAGILDKMIAVN